MSQLPSRILVTLVLGALTSPVPLSAQATVEIGPSLGIYFPLSSYDGPIGSGFPPFTARGDWTQSNGFAVGVSATVWLGQRWGLGATYHHASSSVSLSSGNISSGRFDGSVQVLTAEVHARLGDPDRAFQLIGIAGASYVKRGGDAFAHVNHHDAVGGVLGLGSRHELGSRLVVSGSVRLLVYSLQLQDQTTTYKASLQTDILGQLVLAYRLF